MIQYPMAKLQADAEEILTVLSSAQTVSDGMNNIGNDLEHSYHCLIHCTIHIHKYRLDKLVVAKHSNCNDTKALVTTAG
jgi:hypothetical protein